MSEAFLVFWVFDSYQTGVV